MSSHRRRDRIPWASVAMWILVIAYAMFFSAASIQKHRAFQSTDFDLGNLSQVIWNTLHGRLFLGTNPEGAQPEISLGIHVRPIFLPISLLYLVWDDPRALLILQSVVIALGAWPVFWLARDALPGRWARSLFHVFPLFFAIIYLLYPALQSANMFDFHPAALAPTLLLLAFYTLERERWGWFALWAGLAMACQEDIALVVAMMGFYALIFRRHWRAGLATLAVSLTWFALAVGVILPYFDRADASPFASRYGYLGENPLEMALTFVTRPRVVIEALLTPPKLTYLRDLLLPVGFLSLLAPQVLVIGLPPVLTNLLSTKELMHHLEGFHYSVTVVPFVVVSAAYGGAWLVRRFSRPQSQVRVAALLASGVLVCSFIYHSGHGYLPFGERFRWPPVTDHHRLGEAMARQIPAEASVSALPRLHPHASNRALMYAVNRIENGQLARVDGVEYVWLDVTNSWPIHPNDLKRGVEGLLAGDYGVEAATDGWLLLRRGAPDKELPDRYTPSAQPTIQRTRWADFGGELALTGFGLALEGATPDPGEELGVTLYWQALEQVKPAYTAILHLVAPDGTSPAGVDERVLGGFYQADVWPQDVTILDRHQLALPPDLPPGHYRLDLGLYYPGHSDQLLPVEGGDRLALASLAVGEISASPQPAERTDIDFGEQIRLLGYDLQRDNSGPQGMVHVTLHWQGLAPVDRDYTVFVHLLDPDGTIVAQDDGPPGDPFFPTSTWLPGEFVSDSHQLALPAHTPSGDHTLLVGLYHRPTAERLQAVDSDGLSLGDAVPLVTIRVGAESP